MDELLTSGKAVAVILGKGNGEVRDVGEKAMGGGGGSGKGRVKWARRFESRT